ncbi:MAG TPA: hypothetical protein VMN82_17530 [Thermoanaerobaculia bacterium]|nr:hypothetical protein [Thermoanaerobaculia bacterium]
MTPRLLYRISAVLIFLFAVGHTMGYPWSDPAWAVDLVAMQSSRFTVMGFSRTYWDFYLGFGLFGSVFLLLAAVLAWQLGSLPESARPALRVTSWALALCFLAVAVLGWKYFFTIPIVFPAAITVCLVLAAWRSSQVAPAA